MYGALLFLSLPTEIIVFKLDMLGYDMSWASFHVIETMSSPKFHLKSVGYLGGAQTFNEDTDVLMLTTNLLKKVRGKHSQRKHCQLMLDLTI